MFYEQKEQEYKSKIRKCSKAIAKTTSQASAQLNDLTVGKKP
jgi:hypothetical protein